MKLKRLCSALLLAAMLLSLLAACGPASLQRGDLDPDVYETLATAQNVAVSGNLGDIRVMSFNLQGTMSTDATLEENRYLAVLGQIQDYAPTLLGLQEDKAHWNTYLTKELVTNGTYKRINSSVSASSEYCSIYYNTEILGTPIDQGAYYLSHDGTAGSKYSVTWAEIPDNIKAALNMTEAYYKQGKTGKITYYDTDNKQYVEKAVSVLTSRMMSYGIFELNGQKFLYVNTHLTHRSQGYDYAEQFPEYLELRQVARMKEWDILHANVTKLLEKYGDMPVVITGDLNEVLGSPSYNHYDVHYDNAAKLAKLRKGQDGSWNGAWSADTNGAMNKNISLKDNTSSSTLDYCFISPNDFTVEQYQVAECYQYVTNSAGTSGYVVASDHLAIITDLRFGTEDAPMTLEKPGFEKEGSVISYYDAAKGYDYSWFDEACIANPTKQYTFTLETANQLLSFINLRQNDTRFQKKYFFDNVTIKLGANMVFNKLKDGVSVLSSLDDLQTDNAWIALNSAYFFNGTFDGQGHYISGVILRCGSGGAKGLLGAVGGNAVIKDFSLVNTYMTTPTAADKFRMGSIAAVVAAGSNVLFHNVESSAIIVPPSDTAPSFNSVGGILGYIGTASTVAFEHCTFSGKIVVNGTGEKIGGIIGRLENTGAKVTLSNCVNAGSITGDKYVGGLIGYASAASLYVNDCANLGDVTAGRCSGGLIGTIDVCDDLNIANCAVMADLDFSQIGAGGTAENPVSVPAGCQVGGLIGRTYDVEGHISGISLSGSMKGTSNISTLLDKGTNGVNANYLASGGIVGFNAIYPGDEAVMTGTKTLSFLHYDTILVAMEMTDVESYLGGTRDAPVTTTHSRFSYKDIVYDKEKFEASGASLWGYRIDKERKINSSGENNSQVDTPYGVSTTVTYTAKGLDAKVDVNGNAINHYSFMPKFTTWQQVNGGVLVPTVALRDAIHGAMKTDDLFVLSYQTKPSAEDASLTDYRFVSVMKDTGLPAVGYHVTMSYIDDKGVRASSTETVYCRSVYASIKGGDEIYTASEHGGDYMFTLVIQEVPVQTVKDIVVTIQPFAAEKNGEEIAFTDYRARTYAFN